MVCFWYDTQFKFRQNILLMLIVLKKFRENDMDLVNKEMDELEEEKEKLETESKASWRDLFTKRPLVRALIVTIGIQIAQQLSGSNICF